MKESDIYSKKRNYKFNDRFCFEYDMRWRSIAKMRKKQGGKICGGVDENKIEKLFKIDAENEEKTAPKSRTKNR